MWIMCIYAVLDQIPHSGHLWAVEFEVWVFPYVRIYLILESC